MKCELKYMAHENKKLIEYTTWRQLIIEVPIATIITLFLNWWIGIYCMAAMVMAALLVCLIISFREAVTYCNKKSD